MDLQVLPLVWAGFGLAVMSPGPNLAMLPGTAARDGRPAAAAAACGMALGELAWGLAAALSADTVTRLFHRIQRGFDAVLGTVLAGRAVRLLRSP